VIRNSCVWNCWKQVQTWKLWMSNMKRRFQKIYASEMSSCEKGDIWRAHLSFVSIISGRGANHAYDATQSQEKPRKMFKGGKKSLRYRIIYNVPHFLHVTKPTLLTWVHAQRYSSKNFSLWMRSMRMAKRDCANT